MRRTSEADKRRTRRIAFRKGIVAAAALGILAATVLLIWGSIRLLTRHQTVAPEDFSYASFVSRYAEEYDVPETVVYAVIETESHFDPNAESPVGACGLMQLMPETYEWILGKLGDAPSDLGQAEGNAEEAVSSETPNETEKNIFDPEINIRCGVYYLSYLYDRFGVWETAYAGYNAGPNIVSRWLSDERYSSDGVTLSSIPYTETANYVIKVSDARKRYEEQNIG